MTDRSEYSRLGKPGETVKDPRYIVEYKGVQWGTHRVGFKTILLGIQLHYNIPPFEFTAYLLNNADEKIIIRRLSGKKAAEEHTVREIYTEQYGEGAWKTAMQSAKQGIP